jgi:hypothetical protein
MNVSGDVVRGAINVGWRFACSFGIDMSFPIVLGVPALEIAREAGTIAFSCNKPRRAGGRPLETNGEVLATAERPDREVAS